MKPTPQQRICIEETYGMPSALVAGAGSGKTATLTNRIVYALQHPELSGANDINEILAITFTNKAAGELKSRVKSALQSAGMGEQALKVDGAWISTIHGMCSRILRENALAFGVDPEFCLASDDEAERLRLEAVEEVLAAIRFGAGSEELADSWDRAAWDAMSQRTSALFREYGRDVVLEMIDDLLGLSADSCCPMRELFVVPPSRDLRDCVTRIILAVQELYGKSCQMNGKAAEKWTAAVESSLQRLLGRSTDSNSDIMAPPSDERLDELERMQPSMLLELVNTVPKLGKSHGDLACCGLEVAGGVPAMAALYDLAAALQAEIARPYMDTLLDLTELIWNRFDRKKTERGIVTNDDLLALASHALSDPDNEAIRQRYRNRFALVMVDEFQDTNQMQVDMINLIAGGDEVELSRKLCVVGDAQQSIYRFRNADLAVFQDHVARVRQGQTHGKGKLANLSYNFRSNGQVLAFNKHVFQQVFDGETYLELLHGRDEGNAKVSVWEGCASPANPDASAVVKQPAGSDVPASVAPPCSSGPEFPRRVNVKMFGNLGRSGIHTMAPASIARDLAALHASGVRAGDMAVLLGKMTHAADYAAALQAAGLRCAITGGSVFSAANEVAVIVDLCFALVNMNDSEALIDVLTSDLFLLTAEDLLQLLPSLPASWRDDQTRLADEFAECVRMNATEQDISELGYSSRLETALRVMSRAVRQVGSRPLSDIVEDVLVQSGWLARLDAARVASGQSQVEGGFASESESSLEVSGNVLKALRLLRETEASDYSCSLALARRFRERIGMLKEAPGVLSAEGDDFVRIMTIHASKGLQFPVVAVSEAEFGRNDNSALNSFAHKGRVYLSCKLKASLDGVSARSLLRPDANDLRTARSFAGEPDAKTLIDALAANRLDAAAFTYAIKRLNAIADAQEHERKLYVACTRAEDCLIIALKQPKDTSTDEPLKVNAVIWNMVNGEGNLNGDDAELDGGAADDAGATCVRQLLPQHTRYDQQPEHDIDWMLRYEYGCYAKPSEEATEGPATDQDADSAVSAASLIVPSRLMPDAPLCEPYRTMRAEGIFSASSIKHESEDADAIDALVDHDAASEAYAASTQSASDGFTDIGDSEGSCVVDDPDSDGASDGVAAIGCQASAADRGSALHAVGEWAATRWAPGERLAMPPHERIAAIGRSWGLTDAQIDQLSEPFGRWLASDAAEHVVGFAQMRPEHPFFVRVDSPDEGGVPLMMQGFIDLLAFDEAGKGSAYVVDYKTGTYLNTDAARRKAYGTQAKCYALALMLQGFDHVELDFVFVDQPSADDPAKASLTHFPAPGEEPYTLEGLRAEFHASVRA